MTEVVRRLVGKNLSSGEIRTIVKKIMQEADLSGGSSLSFVEFEVSYPEYQFYHAGLTLYFSAHSEQITEFRKYFSNKFSLIHNKGNFLSTCLSFPSWLVVFRVNFLSYCGRRAFSRECFDF